MRRPSSLPGHPLPWVLLAVFTAGCFGGAEPEEVVPIEDPLPPPPAPTGTQPNDEDEGAARVAFRFPIDGPHDVMQWANGSFAPEETGVGGGFLTGTFAKQIDLGALLPAEVPTRVTAEVRIDAAQIPIVGPTSRADPVSNDTVWYASHWRQVGDGHYLFDGVAKRSANGTFGIALEAYTAGPGSPPQVAYSIAVRAVAHPQWVPLDVPVALAVRSNETLTFETPEGEEAQLLVYGPDDRLLDRLYFIGAAEWAVPQGATGEIVILHIHGSDGLRIVRDAIPDDPGADLRALTLHRDTGDPQALPLRESTTWTFDAATRPTRVLLHVLGPAGGAWTCTGSLDVEVIAPVEPVLEGTADCPSPTNVPFLYAEEHRWATGLGDPRLSGGTYTARVHNTLWSGHVAYHVVEWYER